MPAWCFPVEALTQPRSSIAGTERSTEPATSVFSTILAEDVVSMRRGAHEGKEIVRRMWPRMHHCKCVMLAGSAQMRKDLCPWRKRQRYV